VSGAACRAANVVAAKPLAKETRWMADDAAVTGRHVPALPASFTVKDEPSAAPADPDAPLVHAPETRG